MGMYTELIFGAVLKEETPIYPHGKMKDFTYKCINCGEIRVEDMTKSGSWVGIKCENKF